MKHRILPKSELKHYMKSQKIIKVDKYSGKNTILSCNTCGKDMKYQLELGRNNQSQLIRLCDSCLEEMVDKILEVL